MDIVTDLTTVAVSYITLFQDILRNNSEHGFSSKLVMKNNEEEKELWDTLAVKELYDLTLDDKQEKNIKYLISPFSDQATNKTLSKKYFSITLNILKWYFFQNKNNHELNNQMIIFQPPFFWRQQIKTILNTQKQGCEKLATTLQYMPLQVIFALDTSRNEIDPYNVRLYQLYLGSNQLPQDSDEVYALLIKDNILDEEDCRVHEAWWNDKYEVVKMHLGDNKRLLKGLIVNEKTFPFETFFGKELDEIAEARKARKKELDIALYNNNVENPDEKSLFDPLKRAQKMKLKGLAFSGGGIRSASFNLGILQKLAELNVLHEFDYISTVSGGGYIGTWFSSWVKRTGSLSKVSDRLNPKKSEDPLADEVRPIRWLRMFSNYLSPNVGIMSSDAWASGMTWLRNTVVIQFVLLLTLVTVQSCILDFYDLFCSFSNNKITLLPPFAFLVWSLGIFGSIALLVFIAMNLTIREGYEISRKKMTVLNFLISNIIDVLLIWSCICAFAISSYFAILENSEYIFYNNGDTNCYFWSTFGSVLFSFLFIAFLGNYHKTQNNSALKRTENNNEWKYKFKVYSIIIGASVFSTIVFVLLLSLFWTFIYNIHYLVKTYLEISRQKVALILGIPFILETFSIAVIVRMALMGNLFPDARREWWGRMGGYVHRFIFFWILISFAALVMPSLFHAWVNNYVFAAWGGWSGLVAWGVKKAFESKDEILNKSRSYRTIVIKAVPYLFMIGFLLIGAWVTDKIRGGAHEIPEWGLSTKLCCFLLTIALGLCTAIISWRVGVNEFSLHHFYRNRLTRAYLGATRTRAERKKTADDFTGFDSNDDFPLESMTTKDDYFGPYPIINATLNSTVVSALDRQDRKGESFIFSPLFCGYDFSPTRSSTYDIDHVYEYGYRPTKEFSNKSGGPTMGTTMAISGAAINPNWGYDSSTSLAFLLTVFNVRLGWWIGNPRLKKWKKSDPNFGLLYLLRDLMGKSDINMSYVCLSDGGHFDNMGLYELIRRRCQTILLCDAEQDQDGVCEGLANAIRRCRIDFGVEIDIDISDITKKEKDKDSKHIAKGTITYPGLDEQKQIGTLIYVKTALTGDEPVDIREYALANPDFPQQSTVDQFFDEAQFESYRKLGYHSINSIKL